MHPWMQWKNMTQTGKKESMDAMETYSDGKKENDLHSAAHDMLAG